MTTRGQTGREPRHQNKKTNWRKGKQKRTNSRTHYSWTRTPIMYPYAELVTILYLPIIACAEARNHNVDTGGTGGAFARTVPSPLKYVTYARIAPALVCLSSAAYLGPMPGFESVTRKRIRVPVPNRTTFFPTRYRGGRQQTSTPIKIASGGNAYPAALVPRTDKPAALSQTCANAGKRSLFSIRIR